jgi:hypothetical protein
MADVLLGSVDAVKKEIYERISELQGDPIWRDIQRLYQGLGNLEDLCGIPRTELGALMGISISTNDGPTIDKFEFVTDTPLEAAKKFLRKIAARQKAASMDEIVNALGRGGLVKIDRDELAESLSRSTAQIYKVSDDVYGLLENFPNVRRGSPGRKKSTTQRSNGGSMEASNGQAEHADAVEETTTGEEEGTEQN